MKTPLKVYIAGPDVFHPNARAIADHMREQASTHGIIALIPIDNEIKATVQNDISLEIFHSNVAMIHQADAIIANISPFRGPSADAGTVWEIGFAHALGKPIHAFSTDRRDYKQRVTAPDGMEIEDFGNIDNLMIAHALVAVHDTIGQALAAVSKSLIR